MVESELALNFTNLMTITDAKSCETLSMWCFDGLFPVTGNW